MRNKNVRFLRLRSKLVSSATVWVEAKYFWHNWPYMDMYGVYGDIDVNYELGCFTIRCETFINHVTKSYIIS